VGAVQKIFIIHGFMAGPDSHWFSWLKQQAEQMGAEVRVLQMPNSSAPDDAAWRSTMKSEVRDADENTFFVGHSLGCVTALRFIESLHQSTRVGGVVMVSGFSGPVDTLPELDGFTHQSLDFELLKKRILQRAVLLSLNDDIVAPKHSLKLSQDLDAELQGIPHGGHFLDRDGFERLDKAWEILKAMLKNG
jgi:predicted alpha/beta hydrolase family esterase